MSTPVVVIALLGLGYATPVAETVAHLTGAASVDAVKIGWIAACMLVFVVARTYMFQVYQFLFVDVIPAEVMGKFIGCYRAVGALGAFGALAALEGGEAEALELAEEAGLRVAH